MSRYLEILQRARMEGDLFMGQAAPVPSAPASVVHGRASGNVRDQWQQLVHQLFLRARTGESVAIGFAAATSGEGTSFVASHLASELARSSQSPSLLLEANLYRPSQAHRHGVEPDPGLRRILVEKDFPVEQGAKQSPIEHLRVMPAGSAAGETETPDWSRFPRIFQALRARFSGIVVDLPPVNLSSDAVLLGPELDGLVLVVQADLCSREVIRNAIVRLERANRNVLGTILNKRKFVIPDSIYRRL